MFHLQNSLFACLSEGAEFEYAGKTDVELEVIMTLTKKCVINHFASNVRNKDMQLASCKANT